jgi:hypothetical protein
LALTRDSALRDIPAMGTEFKHRYARVITVALTFITTFAIGHEIAFASASSGEIYFVTTGPYFGGNVDSCGIANINDTAYNEGWVLAHRSPGGCGGTAVQMPAGWLGVAAHAWRDGAYCGATATSYSTVTISYWATGSALCSNPAGSQSFSTLAVASVWGPNGGGWQWYSGLIWSPSATY